MRARFWTYNLSVVSLAVVALIGAGCGSSGSSSDGRGATSTPVEMPPDSEPEPPGPTDPEPPVDGCDTTFTGTFDAIQQTIFEPHGCTAEACHGSAASGGLDLSADVSYANLLEVSSTGSAFPRIRPGDNDRSYLWLKLAAKTTPEAVAVGGSTMPIGSTALSMNELELVRVWIKAGAPVDGTVDETQDLVDGCLPDPEPIIIRPLDPPSAEEGLQLVMPQYELGAGTEREICLAQYYDLTDEVPAEFQNAAGSHFRISASDLRQDPQSHHLILYGLAAAHSSSFGEFFCAGGERHGEPCEATDIGGCGEGAACASAPVNTVACIGVGEFDASRREQLMVAQQSNEVQELADGVFAEIPLKGYWLWNSHAFNVTTQSTMMHARLNYTYATEQRVPISRLFAAQNIFGQSTPPYGTETLCQTITLPEGARLFNLISHTHKRGKRFWVEMADGTQIYENFVYNDPTNQYYKPALAFDSPDAADREITFCAYYENGLDADGEMDPIGVKRRSNTPANAAGICQPVACTAGDVGASCSGSADGASCDSSPGAGDGVCDACVLGGGVSTEDEMLLLMGAYYVE
ncbi:MAG: hypothetical protein P8R42_01065 [Candidatus Binatia bacterium]|nr:hypothetical protein [Candidatus Binatia bacterium]